MFQYLSQLQKARVRNLEDQSPGHTPAGRRGTFSRAMLALMLAGSLAMAIGATAQADPDGATLRVASSRFGLTPEEGGPTASKTGATVGEVHSPLKTTVTLLESGEDRVLLIATEFNLLRAYVSKHFRNTIAEDLQLPVAHVLIMASHNHSTLTLAENDGPIYRLGENDVEPKLLPIGEEFLAELRAQVKRLPGQLEPATVWWAEGEEDRITYNRKGRRADGSTYFMRERDRRRLGKDFNGDMDTQAPVVLFKNDADETVAGLAQFTGHPVTSYHPENPVVFGEWCQVATDQLGEHLGGAPVGFLQGCAGDVNSKEMFHGGVERATEFGHMLGESYIEALADLQPSKRAGMDIAIETVQLPLAPLPPVDVLEAELAEMDDFIRRANDGDEDTLSCVGLNFPVDLSPKYRGRLIELVRPWNVWALEQHKSGSAVPEFLDMEIAVLRLGDVGIVGIPCEPFQGIGRQIRAGSTLPLTIPCGYMNVSHGYITDGPNTGDGEYMSAFYRYTRYRPPLQKPAGDVIADRAVELLNQFAGTP